MACFKLLLTLTLSVMLSDQTTGRVFPQSGESDDHDHKAESCKDLHGTVPMLGNIPDSFDCTKFYMCVPSGDGQTVGPVSMNCSIGHNGLPLFYDFRACECSEIRDNCYDYMDIEDNRDRFKCACKMGIDCPYELWKSETLEQY